MLWLSIALVIISSEIVLAHLYLNAIRYPKQLVSDINSEDLKERVRLLEDQVSSIRVAQGMRRRDGGDILAQEEMRLFLWYMILDN